ncbi:MAG: 5-bromo-4-chloroindolyl phosphate hydrolysis family protein [Clostridia bacterium]|nr:5-bromo-4-chloroindolyl phosphate hydrolysis family protein [Clostridia bacterium]
MQQKKKNSSKAYVAAFLVTGVALAVYSLIFPFYRWQHFLIGGGVALLLGRIVFIMAQGLDVSKEAPAQQQQEIPKTGNAAVDSLVEKGQEMLAEIRKENDLIPDEKLSAQMDQLDDVADRIFRTVAEQPGKAPQIRRFMDYYLPTTLKMLQGYRKMDERQVSGTEADATRAQIRQAMDVVLKAFDKQLHALYQDDMLDLSTDIDVMEAMLKQDGLVDTGIKGEQKK